MPELYPPIEPYDHGMLDVGDGNLVYWEEGALLRDAGRLAGVPGVLIHGRLDLGGPLRTAWELARAWPDAELVVVPDSGHTGSDTLRERKLRALDAFASR